MHSNAKSPYNDSPYFNTQQLSQYTKINSSLINDGFAPINFISSDGYQLKGLYLQRANTSCNVIICAGFYPGRKEGMATLTQLLPQNCNILLIDARGHGESSGPFLQTILWYGQNEYKDIIGALNFLQTQNNNPNILLGVCIGAFHCAHAILALQKQRNFDDYKLKGIIFDSGFGSLKDLLTIPIIHFNEKILPTLLTTYCYPCENKKSVKSTLLFKASSFLSNCIGSTLTYSVSPFFYWYEGQTNLFDKIKNITIPIQFIHSNRDSYVDITIAKNLHSKAKNHSFTIFNESKHALNHILYPDKYKELLLEFIKKNVHT